MRGRRWRELAAAIEHHFGSLAAGGLYPDKSDLDLMAIIAADVEEGLQLEELTLCRALYALATGKQATKEEAATWAAARYPEWSRFISDAHATYRADVRDAHHALISFTDYAAAQADEPNR